MLELTTLQSLVWPAPDDDERRALFYAGPRRKYAAGGQGLLLQREDALECTTYFNALCLTAWKKYTHLDSFYFCFQAIGHLKVRIMAWPDPDGDDENSPVPLTEYIYKSDTADDIQLPLPPCNAAWLTVHIEAISTSSFLKGEWAVSAPSTSKPVNMAVVICSCHREEVTYKKANELQSLAQAEDNITIIVVDNGQTLEQSRFLPGVRLYANINAGGAGGFTRGIIEALKSADSFTHVLLTDDDAEIMPETLRRTISLLQLASPEYAGARIAGAMMNLEQPTVLHASLEYRKTNGAILPLHPEADTTLWSNVIRYGQGGRDIPESYPYGAWWYCVIALQPGMANDLPLPFFFRNDDVEYGIRFSSKGGRWMALNGICCFHPSFENRTPTPLRTYFSTRNAHIIQAFYDFSTSGAALRIYQALLPCHYERCRARLEALRDFSAGPELLKDVPVPEELIARTQYRPWSWAPAWMQSILLFGALCLQCMGIRIRRKNLAKQWQGAASSLQSLAFWKHYLQLP